MAHLSDLEVAIRHEAAEARRDPAMLAAFEALRLNLGTEDAEVSVLLDVRTWRAAEGEADRHRPTGLGGGPGDERGAIGGRRVLAGDRSARMYRGLPAAIPIFASEASAMAWVGLYSGLRFAWRAGDTRGRGSAGGRATGARGSTASARPARVVADRWREAELRDALDKAGVPPAAVATRGYGLSGRRGGRSRVPPRRPGGARRGRAVATAALGDGRGPHGV